MKASSTEPLFVTRSSAVSRLIRAQLAILRGIRQFRARDPGGLIIVPPAEPNSLGDAAMVGAVCTEMRRRGASPIISLNHQEGDRWAKHEPGIAADFTYEGLGHRNRVTTIRSLARISARASDCILIGADVMDGGYGDWHAETKLDLLRVLQATGTRVHVLGFSYKERASAASIKAFRSLGPARSICLRDPGSHRRFTAATGLEANLGADLAFLFEAKDVPTPADDWIAAHRARGALVVGYNTNGLLQRYCSSDHTAYLGAHRELLVRLLSQNSRLAITLVPHDARHYGAGLLTDPEISTALGEDLQTRFPGRVLSLPMPKNATEVAALVGRWDAAVSGRMHLGIACLRAGVPVACWEFQDKVTGLLSGHFGSPEAVLNLQDLKQPDKIAGQLGRFLSDHEALAKRVREKLPAVKALARVNFSRLPASFSGDQ